MAYARKVGWLSAVLLCLGLAGLRFEAHGAQLTQTAPGLPNLRASAVAWGDIDNDGDLDLAISGLDATGQAVTKVYKNAAGTLTEDTAQQLSGLIWGSLAWGDVDNDGKLDLAISGQGSSGDAVFGVSEVYRNVNGVLTKDPAQLIGPPPFFETKQLRYSAVAWADYTNDGRLDLLIAGIDKNGFVATKLYRNDHDILTEDITQSIVAVRNGSVAWGDFDGDGLPDLAMMGLGNDGLRTTKVYLNQDGLLIEASNISLTPVYGGSLAWGDYDRDGNLDLAISGWDEHWNAVLKVYHNNALRGTLEEAASLQVGGKGLVGTMAWGDFDNDGDLDLGVSGRNEFTTLSTAVFLNNGGASFSLANEPALIGEMNGAIAWGDVNGDTRLDLLVTGERDDGSLLTTLYTNSGTANTLPGAPTLTKPFVTSKGIVFRWTEGTDAPAETPAASLTYNMRLGTTPGGNELLSAAVIGSNANKGAGPGNVGRTLIKTLRFPVSVDSLYWSVQTVDGGFERSAFATQDTIIIQRLVNSEQQLVGLRQNILGQAAAWGDYNNDGWVDLVIGGQDINGDARTLLYRNDVGTLTQDNTSTLNGLENGALVWGDYDRDGDLDLLQSGEDRFGNAFTYLYKNTSGTFQVDTNQKYDSTHLSHLKEGGAAWGDYNNDGRLDLAASGLNRSGARSTYIYKNVGPGDTLVVAQEITGTANGTLAWADIDNDGDLDLVICGESGSPSEFIPILKVYKNTSGILDSSQALTGLFSSALAVGDVDNDGDVDLAITGGDASFIPRATLYTNNGTGTYAAAQTLTGTFGGTVAWGDYDNDGDLDLILTGQDVNSQVVTILYRNDGGTLTQTSVAVLPGSVFSAAAWADYDNDRDLDLALTGGTGSNFKEFSQVFDNLTGQTAPNSAPTAPLSLTAQPTGNTVRFTWNDGTDPETVAPGLTYSLRVGTAPGKNDIVSGIRPVGFGSQGHANVDTLKNLADSTYYWAVRAIDAGLATSTESAERQFIIDTTPPRVASVSVDPPIAGIGAVVTIVINFDEKVGVDNTASPAVEFTPKLHKSPTVPVEQLSYNGPIWTGKVTITSAVPTDTAVIAVSGTKDLAGNVMSPVTEAGTFRVDTAIPVVASTVPTDGQLGVSASITIKATFTKPIDPLSLTSDTFKARRLDQPGSVTGTLTYDAATYTALFTPSTKLAADAEYEVVATAGIKDIVGNRLSADKRWTFRTAKVVSTSQGGRFQDEANDVSLYIPPNAFDADKELSLEPVDSTALAPFLPKVVGPGSAAALRFVGPAFRFLPADLQVKGTKPATLTMKYGTLPSGVDASKLAIFRQNDTTPTTWDRIGGSVNQTAKTVTTVVIKLGTYAVFEDTSPQPTGVALSEFRAQPRVLSPQGNRFNTQEAAISFKLGQSMPVTVEVYNLAGRLERVLCRNQTMGPGAMVEVWDGKDDGKRFVRSGLYIIIIDAGGHQEKLPISVLND